MDAADGKGAQPRDFSLSVQHEEVSSVKPGAAVYVRKSKLFFRTSKQEALEHIDGLKCEQPSAAPQT